MAVTTILPEVTLSFVYNDYFGAFAAIIESSIFLEENVVYRVTWESKIYTCTSFAAQYGDTLVHIIGNPVAVGGEDNEMPFVIACDPASGDTMAFCFAEGTYTFSITQGEERSVIVRDFAGRDVLYAGVEQIALNTNEGDQQLFTKGALLENVTTDVDFSEGDMHLQLPEGYLAKEATIKKPENLIPGNIKAGETVAGIPGEYEGETVELEEVTVDLAMANGDQVIEPTEGKALGKVTLTKPETLVPENIAEGVHIAGIVGTFSGGGGLDISQVASCTIPEVDSEAITIVGAYAFYGYAQLSKVNAPNLTEIGSNAFEKCTSLTEVRSPKLTKIGSNAFNGCTALETIDVSNVQSVGAYAFSSCKNLKILDFGTSLNSRIGSSAFSTSGPVGVIIRNTSMIPDATNVYGYLFGMTTQRLYVPRSMVTTWQNSNYMKSYHKNLVVAIEDYPEICG